MLKGISQSQLNFIKSKEVKMSQDNEHAVPNPPIWPPKVGACYKNGWRQLWKYILELLLISSISLVISLSGHGFYVAAQKVEGIESVFCNILALLFTILLSLPINYGVSFAYLKAARGDQLKVKDMFAVFGNYLNAVLANLLVVAIIIIGTAFLIVPGIIFACRLAFTPYLVVERKMEVIKAVKGSWRITKGHSWQVFLIGLLVIPIFIAGLICCCVGVIASMMWIALAFASLYHAVIMSGETSARINELLEVPYPSEDTERIERIEQELQDAQETQRSILPAEAPIFAGLDISGYFSPATEIGGDYYDYIPLTETKLAVAIGDVKGHGISAGLLVSTASGCLHTMLENTQSIEEVMRVINRRIYEVKGRIFMTFCFSILDTENCTLMVSSAGHPLPYHYCSVAQTLTDWELEGRFPLGVREDCECPVHPLSLAKGDVLVYYSDGLVEGANSMLQPFGFERLEAAIRKHAHHTAYDMKEAILTEFSAHCQQYAQEDDVALIVIKFVGIS